MKSRKEIISLSINDQIYELAVEPQQTLIEILRQSIGLTGTKEGCGTGECGSCTVLRDGKPILSCLTLAIECNDCEITTIEGVGSSDSLSIVQQAYLEKGGVQCGFCTPGMVLATTALLNKNSNPSDKEINDSLDGHLCRCTGYNKILESVAFAAEKSSGVEK